MTNNKALSIFNQLRPVTVGFDNVFDHFERMFEDDYFKDAVRERFDYYYSNLASFQAKIDEFESYLSVSQAKNFELYPGILDPNVELWPVPERFDNHHGYVDHLKNWINARMEWLNTWL